MAYVKTNPNAQQPYTEAYVGEGDDRKVVQAGRAVDLTKAEQAKLEEAGFSFVKSSKDEAEAEGGGQEPGIDVADESPDLGREPVGTHTPPTNDE